MHYAGQAKGVPMDDEKNREGYLLLPVNENQDCFGCSPRNPNGLHMEFYLNEERDSVVSWYTVPDHLCGWANLVHGGVVTTLLDEVMGWTALVVLQKFLLSKSIAVDFLKPVLAGSELKIQGRVLEVKSDKEAVTEGSIYDQDEELCARAYSLIKLISFESIQETGAIDQHTLDYLESLWDLSSK